MVTIYEIDGEIPQVESRFNGQGEWRADSLVSGEFFAAKNPKVLAHGPNKRVRYQVLDRERIEIEHFVLIESNISLSGNARAGGPIVGYHRKRGEF